MMTKNNIEYLLSKGIAEMLLNHGLITSEEYKELDTLNKQSFIC